MTADPASVVPALLACPVLADVPRDAIRLLAEIMGEERYGAGETVWEAGAPGRDVCVVAEGRLEVFVAGVARPVRSLARGELLGVYSLFAGGARTATVRAAEPTVVFSMDGTRFLAFLETAPAALLALLGETVRRLVECEERLRRSG